MGKSNKTVAVTIRVPEGLKEQFEALAKKRGQSFNAEMRVAMHDHLDRSDSKVEQGIDILRDILRAAKRVESVTGKKLFDEE
jgi:predicted transcriptional regulator